MEPITFTFADRATVPGFLGLEVQTELLGHLFDLKADRILLVTDEAVEALHADYFAPLMGSNVNAGDAGSSPEDPGAAGGMGCETPPVNKIVLPSGDEAKSWENLTKLVQWSFESGASKRTVVVAFGGGALLNVVGLFASIVFRGLKLVYVPTTFLAMHDVVTSLKTSICFDGRKNNIGSFYAPLMILIDVAFCRTLPRCELFSGLGELAKNALLFGGEHCEGFVQALSKANIDGRNGGSGEEFSLDDDTMVSLVRLGIKAKMTVLLKDALEKTSGMVFEYGHTVSHAIEKAYGDGTIPHGLGVVYGMLSSSFAAEKLGIMSPEERRKHDDVCELLIHRWPLPLPRPDVETIMALAMKDSKRGITSEADDEISDVLLYKVGDIVPTKTSSLSKFPSSLVREWLHEAGFPAAANPAAAKSVSSFWEQ